MSRRQYQELFRGTGRFTEGTRTRLERAVGRALFGRKSSTVALRTAVYDATRELRAQGLDGTASLAFLGAMVEGAGRGCRADRASLLSGEPLWASVRALVLNSAQQELTALTA